MQIFAKMSYTINICPPWIVGKGHEDAGKEAEEERNEPRVRR